MQPNYPNLPTTNSHPSQYPQLPQHYSSLPQYHNEPIQVGVPIHPNQIPYSHSHSSIHNAMPYPQPNNNQYQANYVPSGYNPENPPQPNYNYDQYNYPPETQYLPQGQQPYRGEGEEVRLNMQGENSSNMIQNTVPMPEYKNLNAEMIPVVYDPALLHKISSREPQLALCAKCNKYVQTTVKYEIGKGTLISSTFMALFGALACSWIPCCINDMKDAVHYCPVCSEMIGKKKFMVN